MDFVPFVATMGALQVVTVHLNAVQSLCQRGQHPDLDQAAAELRDVLEKAAETASEMLRELTGPIWGELPSPIRDVCKAALMEPDVTDDS